MPKCLGSLMAEVSQSSFAHEAIGNFNICVSFGGKLATAFRPGNINLSLSWKEGLNKEQHEMINI